MKDNPCKAIVWFALLLCLAVAAWGQTGDVIVVDASAPAHVFPHFWEQMFGSGRAILTLRESYRNDLKEVKRITDLRYVRFHAIFHDEVGVYDENEQGQPTTTSLTSIKFMT